MRQHDHDARAGVAATSAPDRDGRGDARDGDALVRGYAVTHSRGRVRLPQDGRWDQLIHASDGIVRLETDDGMWVLPPLRAAWVPAGVAHRCTVTQGTAMRTLYLRTRQPLLPRRTAVLEVTPLIRELIAHLVASAPRFADDVLVHSELHVLEARLRDLAIAPLQLPAPTSPPCRAVAAALRDAPGAHRSVADLAAAVGLSRRALERAFRRETGMTPARWRTRLRLVVALERLADGQPVGRVASDLGYATQSAFGAMFKSHLGVSPAAYFAG